MLDFGADQNFDMNYAEAVWNLNREIHIRHVSEDGISDAVDDQILEWASAHGLVLLTHDRRTIPNFAYQRLGQGLPATT